MQSIKINETQTLIVTTDNAGSIGEKQNDQVKIDYKNLSYFTFKNALMDNLSNHTKIISVSFSNFCGEKAYNDIYAGIKQLTDKLGYPVSITSSTESNFSMSESALGITVIGIKENEDYRKYNHYAVVGVPLVGDEVLDNMSKLLTFEDFTYLLNHPDISKVLTVGSKGIYDRGKNILNLEFKSKTVDVYKSAGPSTCLIIEYSTLINISDEFITRIRLLEY